MRVALAQNFVELMSKGFFLVIILMNSMHHRNQERLILNVKHDPAFNATRYIFIIRNMARREKKEKEKEKGRRHG